MRYQITIRIADETLFGDTYHDEREAVKAAIKLRVKMCDVLGITRDRFSVSVRIHDKPTDFMNDPDQAIYGFAKT